MKANVSGMEAYRELCQEREGLRGVLGQDRPRQPDLAQAVHQGAGRIQCPFYTWYEDGELNVSYNCLDRHLEAAAQDAIIFEADNGQVTKITYKELYTASAASPTA
jgi:acetyl-CoA synthetase